MNENFSVIISAHNEEKYIEKTLESFSKNDVPFELIVICDACSDKTNEIAKKYTDNVYDVNFRNISKVRNFGAEKSSGKILVFGDADTLVSSNYLKEISNSIKNSDFGCVRWISESDTFFGKYIAWVANTFNKKHMGGNFFVKKDLFKSVKGFNEEMIKGEDTDLGDRLKKIDTKCCFLGKCWIMPSERKFRKNGYIYLIIKAIIHTFIYKFFRNYYNKKIADPKIYENNKEIEMIKAIVFDYGGVVETNDFDLFEEIANHLEIKKEDWRKVFLTFNHLYNTEGVDMKEVLSLVAQKFNATEEQIFYIRELSIKNQEKWKVNEGLLDLIKDLKKNYKIGLISNFSAELRQILIDQGIIDLFDPIIISGEVGYQKPEPEIFNILFDKLGVKSNEVVFIDDNQSSLVGAEGIGYIPILFVNNEKLKEDFKKLGVGI